MKAQTPVGAEHRDSVVQLVEGRLLHLNLSVVLSPKLDLSGHVRKQEQQPAEGMRLTHDAQGLAVRRGPELIRAAVEGLVIGELLRLPHGVVHGLRQSAALAQAVEHLAMRRLFRKPSRLQPP